MVIHPEFRIALVAVNSAKPGAMSELYDSGCTNHISPYRDRFENFENIVPRKFRAANQQTFSTTGIGELIIDVPNGDGHFCKLRLSGVQYSPEITYTLVSIGQLDEAGFSVLFGNGKCLIQGPDGEKVGEVLRASRKVYRVKHVEGEASAAEKVLSLERFHHCMGHISFQMAKQLVKDKYITGVQLEYTPSDHNFFASHASMQKPQGNMSRMFVKAIGLSNLGGRCIRTCGGSLLLNLKAENFTTSRSSTTRQDLLIYTSCGRKMKHLMRTRSMRPGWRHR